MLKLENKSAPLPGMTIGPDRHDRWRRESQGKIKVITIKRTKR